MTKSVIHIYGVSGSGTTMLAKAIAESFHYFYMDTDDLSGFGQIRRLRINGRFQSAFSQCGGTLRWTKI